jgi:hypothetical protein
MSYDFCMWKWKPNPKISPGPKDIKKALKTLKPEGNSYAILERSDFGFVKAAVTPTGEYCLEYHENITKQGFRCEKVPIRKVIRLFQQCAAGNYDWKKKFNWHKREVIR